MAEKGVEEQVLAMERLRNYRHTWQEKNRQKTSPLSVSNGFLVLFLKLLLPAVLPLPRHFHPDLPVRCRPLLPLQC